MRKTTMIGLILILVAMAMPIWAEAWKTYTNEDFGFSLEYPEDWIKQIDENSLLTLTSPSESMPVVITLMTEPFVEEDFEEGYDNLLESAITDIQDGLEIFGEDLVRIDQRGEIDFNGIPAYRFDLVIDLLDIMSMRMENTLIRLGGDLLILSFAADQSLFESYSETFEAIRKSFRLGNKQSE